MRPTATKPLVSRSWKIAVLIGLAFLALEYGLGFEVEGIGDPGVRSSLELALVLFGYLFAFCIKPIQKVVLRKLCQHAAQRTRRHTSR